MSVTFDAWLARAAQTRRIAGLQRTLVPRGSADDLVDLAGNDYLGLVRHPRVVAAAADAAKRWGAGAGASRLVTGTLGVHEELESALAAWTGAPAALVHSTGYHANLAAVTALTDADTLVVSDAHIHASLVDACRLSRARVVVTPHGDVAAVDHALRERPEPRALVLTESVFSVLGDRAPLVELADACARHDAVLLVDEAHGLGVAGDGGRGLVHAAGLAARPDVVVTVTLSKSLGSQGGAVLGSDAVIDHLVNRARPFIYDTGLAPAAAAAAREALDVVADEPELVARVNHNAADLAEAACVAQPAGAVLSVAFGGPDTALAAQAACAAEGLRVGCFRPPSVPDGISRLRITASARLDEHDVEHACKVLHDVTRP
ncbi:8-amino-7-oxononanoate synthase [Aeromicrobium sp.]|uniref:8-amino-7-oxononanoate synthase n=1 Tax=Aeromicrobium sp. TaxID=1871063 RepID=UPI003D6C5A8C